VNNTTRSLSHVKPPIYLFVYPQSHLTVRGFVDYLLDMLPEVAGVDVTLRVASTIEKADVPEESIVFLIGFRFPRFPRLPLAYTIFLSFSVMYRLRGLFSASRAARRLMRQKRQTLLAKLPALDMILDFYPRHLNVLKKHVAPSPVMHFPTNVSIPANCERSSISQCEYDVCVVGSNTRRRQRIYRQLECRGLRLSPLTTDDFPSVVGQSKLVLNVRSERYDNLEIPRITTALAMGRVVLSENSPGIHEMFPPEFCRTAPYSQITRHVEQLVSQPALLEDIGGQAATYIVNDYSAMCREQWEEIVVTIQRHAEAKFEDVRVCRNPVQAILSRE